MPEFRPPEIYKNYRFGTLFENVKLLEDVSQIILFSMKKDM
jgi:hypothetical protein